MPLYHCIRCQHEWEGTELTLCNWCGSDSYEIEEETVFEKFISRIYDFTKNLEEKK